MTFRDQIYPITHSLWLGPFASPQRTRVLAARGATHVLNVGEAPSVVTAADGPFHEIAWHPFIDLERLPDHTAVGVLQTLHRMICEPESRVYVHCIAGQNRSPTIVWLYLVACGVSAHEARQIIEARTRDAVPGHSQLVDLALLETVRELGATSFLPHPRPEALKPAPLI